MVRISNFFIFIATVCVLTIIIITTTTIKINEHHEEKLLYAMESKIKVKAKRCYLENKCSDTVTLEYLYNNNYLDEMVNPVTKEVINKNSTVEFIDNNIVITYK